MRLLPLCLCVGKAEPENEGCGEGGASGEKIKFLIEKAEQGDPEAQFDLGLEYFLKKVLFTKQHNGLKNPQIKDMLGR